MKKYLLAGILLHLGLSCAEAQWQKVAGADNGRVYSFTVLDGILFASTSAGIVRSTDNGNTWPIVSSDPFLTQQAALTVIGDTVFAGAGLFGDVFFKSSDSGNTWLRIFPNNGMPEQLSTLHSIGNMMLGLGNSVAIKRSIDNGKSWDTATAGLESNTIACLGTNTTMAFAGESALGQGVYYSTNFGASWEHCKNTGLTDLHVSVLGVFDSVIFATTNDGLFRSRDSGNTWILVLTNGFGPFASSNDLYFAAGYDGFRFSTDLGGTWTFQNGGWPDNTTVPTLIVHDNYLYVGINVNGIWRKKISEFSGVKKSITYASQVIQNYPNPFTSSTTITFTLHSPSEVSISISDALGNEIPLLQSKAYEAGEHSIHWDASSYPSGVYSCRISADGVSETRKMVVVK